MLLLVLIKPAYSNFRSLFSSPLLPLPKAVHIAILLGYKLKLLSYCFSVLKNHIKSLGGREGAYKHLWDKPGWARKKSHIPGNPISPLMHWGYKGNSKSTRRLNFTSSRLYWTHSCWQFSNFYPFWIQARRPQNPWGKSNPQNIKQTSEKAVWY